MIDPADFRMPDPYRDVKHPRLGEPVWHQLPAVQQVITRGLGDTYTVTVAEARKRLASAGTGTGTGTGTDSNTDTGSDASDINS